MNAKVFCYLLRLVRSVDRAKGYEETLVDSSDVEQTDHSGRRSGQERETHVKSLGPSYKLDL